jgi:SSS family solute:Na+ symporter
VAITAAVFILYTFWGGQLSVLRTDAWQLGLFVAALGATLALVAAALPGDGMRGALPPGHLAFPVSEGFGWYELLVFYPVIVGMPYLVGPDIYSRVLCARDEGTARRAALLAASGVIPLSLLLAFLGVMIHAQAPGLAPESALPTAVVELAPQGLRGLVVVGLLGALMSSADTTLISASTILALNVVSPLLGRGRAAGGGADAGLQARDLRLTRAFVVLVGLAAWAIAAFQGGIISSLLLAYTVFVGGVVLPTLGSFWRDRLGLTPGAAMWSVILGGAVAILGEVRDGALLRALLGESGTASLAAVLGPEYGSLLAVAVSAAVLVVGSRVGGRPDQVPPRTPGIAAGPPIR